MLIGGTTRSGDLQVGEDGSTKTVVRSKKDAFAWWVGLYGGAEKNFPSCWLDVAIYYAFDEVVVAVEPSFGHSVSILGEVIMHLSYA